MTAFQVSRPVKWAVAGGSHLPSVLSWTSEDPLAVRIVFGDVTGQVTWVFARDLLADVVAGKCNDTGIGDVRVTRAVNSGLGGRLHDQLSLTLSVQGHVALLRADISLISAFLDNTYIYTPQGTEIVDIDATIVKLLGDEGTIGSA
jgi:hypothetical protein